MKHQSDRRRLDRDRRLGRTRRRVQLCARHHRGPARRPRRRAAAGSAATSAGARPVAAQDRDDLYYTLLLKDLGCSSNAARICELYQADDRAFKQGYKTVGTSLAATLHFIASRTATAAPLHRRAAAIGNILKNGDDHRAGADRVALHPRRRHRPLAALRRRCRDRHLSPRRALGRLGPPRPPARRRHPARLAHRLAGPDRRRVPQPRRPRRRDRRSRAAAPAAGSTPRWSPPSPASPRDPAFWSGLPRRSSTRGCSPLAPPEHAPRGRRRLSRRHRRRLRLGDRRQEPVHRRPFGPRRRPRRAHRRGDGHAPRAPPLAPPRRLAPRRRQARRVEHASSTSRASSTTANGSRCATMPPTPRRSSAASASLADLAPIAAAHHERLDGTGYPLGLTRPPDPPRNAHHHRLRFLRRADQRPPLSRRDAGRTKRWRSSPAKSAPRSTATASRRLRSIV